MTLLKGWREFPEGGCKCAGKSNADGDGAECKLYSGYKEEWFNGIWCYVEIATCSDAREHQIPKYHFLKGRYGGSKLACASGN